MAAENKAANKVTEVKGKIKKKAGRATGDARAGSLSDHEGAQALWWLSVHGDV